MSQTLSERDKPREYELPTDLSNEQLRNIIKGMAEDIAEMGAQLANKPTCKECKWWGDEEDEGRAPCTNQDAILEAGDPEG
jgi:hypothetical protein